MKIYLKLLLPLFFWYNAGNIIAQNVQINADQAQRIGALFEEWNDPNSAGVSVGILSGNQVIYQKNVGSANLACGAMVTPDTKFRLTGMSAHFTAFAALLLEERGQLNLDDDIRKYLADFPKYEQPIRVRHLLSHSSGLPGYWPLKELAGFRTNDVFTAQDAAALYTQQWELGSLPGQVFVYTGTGASLLAKIIAKVAGKSFSAFMQDEIFAPLGMHDTQFVEKPSTIEGLATAYTPDKQVQSVQHFDAGAAGLVSTVNDLMKWYKNLDTAKVGSKRMLEKLDTSIQLDNGSYADWPRGRTTYGQQFMHEERGINKIWDSGAMGGYAASVFRFPSEQLTIVVLSNTGMTYNGYLGMMSANILLADRFETAEAPVNKKSTYTTLTTAQIKEFVGDYYSPESFTQRQIILRDDTLRYYRPNYDSESPLLPLAPDLLHLLTDYDYYTLHLDKSSATTYIDIRVEDESYIYEKYDKIDYTEAQLHDFTGIYYCDALQSSFHLAIKEGILIASNKQHGDIPLSTFKKNQFIGGANFFKLVTFVRNKQGKIIGFDLSQEELSQIRFRRI